MARFISLLWAGIASGALLALTASGVVRDVRRANGPVHGAHVIHHRVD